MKLRFILILVLGLIMTFMIAPAASAANDCTFDTVGNVMTLTGDCTTDATIFVPDGYTLDGAYHTITAVDPSGGHFMGGIIQNAGPVVHITNLTLTTPGLATSCKAGDNRLAGIRLYDASGSVTHNWLHNITQPGSGCQEGISIWASGAGRVEIAHNIITDYMKGGIVVAGTMNSNIHHNQLGSSANQHDLAANGLQLSSTGSHIVQHNSINGNQWLGPSDYAATAVLIFFADGMVFEQNNIVGNSDVGLYLIDVSNSLIRNNRIFDEGPDGPNGDFGIVDLYLTDEPTNTLDNNKIREFVEPIYGADQGSNKIIGNPNGAE